MSDYEFPHAIGASDTKGTVTLGTFVTPDHLCPDLLRHEQIAAADGWRGRTVRAFFWLMRAWPV